MLLPKIAQCKSPLARRICKQSGYTDTLPTSPRDNSLLPTLPSCDESFLSPRKIIDVVLSPIVSNEGNRQAAAEWKVVLLGRTFNNKSVQEVADCLVTVLNIDTDQALHEATSARCSTASVVSKCRDCQEACEKAQLLSSKGLLVQVVSDHNATPSSPPYSPRDTGRKEVRRRRSYSDVFEDAQRGKPWGARDSLSRRGSFSHPGQKVDVKGLALAVLESGEDKGLVSPGRPSAASVCSQAPTASASDCDSLEFRGTERSTARSTCMEARWTTSTGRSELDVMDDVDMDTDVQRKSRSMVTNAKAEASALLRFLAFGERLQEIAQRLEDPSSPASPNREPTTATKDQVHKLVCLWEAMYADGSDSVGRAQLRKILDPKIYRYFYKVRTGRGLPSWAKMTPSEKACENFANYTRRLRNKVAGHLLGRNSCFTSQDLLRLAFINANPSEMETIRAWFIEINSDPTRKRARTPPCLAPLEYQDLCAVFKHFAGHESEHITFEKLVSLGLIHADEMHKTRRDWDADGNGLLEMSEFCEMMCPLGYRASLGSRVGTLEDGRRVVINPADGKWMLDNVGMRATS